MRMNQSLAQTGRTTRLIERACMEALNGRAVYVFAHDEAYARMLKKKVDEIWQRMVGKGRKHGIRVENMAYWDDRRMWNWERMLPAHNDWHPNCLWLVDHAAVEMQLIRIDERMREMAALAGSLYPHTV